ncbi:hypothetical protein [Pseudomonas sp. FeS53a]|uniref:hypothetical protein n=1 Tax=Pseudomonas sp. FeS53a TaxID=1604022 RepID=UPI000A82198C|nr:hypothetical protein [Pseudomonas sp. FeS53a]
MPEAKRTAIPRSIIRAQLPKPEVLEPLETLIDNLAAKHSLLSEIRSQLPSVAYDLARAISAYSLTKGSESDSEYSAATDAEAWRNEHRKLIKLAKEMSDILSDPASKSCISPACINALAYPPREAQALLGNLHKLIQHYENRPQNRLNVTAPKTKLRGEIYRGIKMAWETATNTKVPGRKTSSTNQHVGEFPDFVRAVLDLTAETRAINVDDAHRAIRGMGK